MIVSYYRTVRIGAGNELQNYYWNPRLNQFDGPKSQGLAAFNY